MKLRSGGGEWRANEENSLSTPPEGDPGMKGGSPGKGATGGASLGNIGGKRKEKRKNCIGGRRIGRDSRKKEKKQRDYQILYTIEGARERKKGQHS